MLKFINSGIEIKCGNGITDKVHPILSQICADFMEAIYYTGTRGPGADFPCPICLVPSNKLSYLHDSMRGCFPKTNCRADASSLEGSSQMQLCRKRSSAQKTWAFKNHRTSKAKWFIYQWDLKMSSNSNSRTLKYRTWCGACHTPIFMRLWAGSTPSTWYWCLGTTYDEVDKGTHSGSLHWKSC